MKIQLAVVSDNSAHTSLTTTNAWLFKVCFFLGEMGDCPPEKGTVTGQAGQHSLFIFLTRPRVPSVADDDGDDNDTLLSDNSNTTHGITRRC